MVDLRVHVSARRMVGRVSGLSIPVFCIIPGVSEVSAQRQAVKYGHIIRTVRVRFLEGLTGPLGRVFRQVFMSQSHMRPTDGVVTL